MKKENKYTWHETAINTEEYEDKILTRCTNSLIMDCVRHEYYEFIFDNLTHLVLTTGYATVQLVRNV